MTRIDAATARRLAPRSAGAIQGSHGERSLATQLLRLQAPAWSIEHRFDPVRRWRFDFAWPELMVAVEVEGGQWVGGHGGERFELDCEKYDEAAIRGWMVLRVTTEMVDDGRAATLVGRALWAASQRGRR